ncbi:phenolic glucoside malonyltransferase 1-like [Mercurialis annua]|uniref:phenolic glucoside malonyltransferase 1-like n=1 Tax=Mercurialis annua TaxID=3986 RepID=UPI00215EC221|nr:phenolic glucoside malonyltransferase 1-like [Mercurialis annua]
MASSSLKILEVCQISPATNPAESSTTEFTLPVTFLDTLWFKFPPVERIFFYQLSESESAPIFFNSVILPHLKQSLSQTLIHFLPLTGHLTWSLSSPKPIISYTQNDSVSVTVAEAVNIDFDNLSGNDFHKCTESHLCIPELPVSDTKASIIALQITLFPKKGFSIGIINHHAILDGKSTTMFMKAWAFISKNSKLEPRSSPYPLPDNLKPFFNREVIKDVAELEMVYLNQWLAISNKDSEPESNPRSLKVWNKPGAETDLVYAIFELTREDIKRLRETASFYSERIKSTYVSSFVLTCAYTFVCMVKAKKADPNRKIYFVFSVDLRTRLDPPVPENYVGNCVSSYDIAIEARSLMEENGVAVMAEKINSRIKGLADKGVFEGARDFIPRMIDVEPGTQVVGVAGSTRFGVYESDFGWGRPKKVETTSVDRTGSIALAESRDGNGGVEIGIAFIKPEMEVFASLFANGIKDLY